MHVLFRIIGLLGVCLFSHVATANSLQISQMVNWHISPITNVAGAPYCIMAAQFDSGLIMTFARNNQNQYSLGIDAQQPYFDVGLNYGVELSVGSQTRKLAAKASTNMLIVANLGPDTNLFDVMASGQTMHVVVANNVINQYVQAKPQAFFELAHCWQGLPKPIVANVPVAKALPLPPTAAIQAPAPVVAMKAPLPAPNQPLLPPVKIEPPVLAPARNALADILAQSRAEAAQTNKLNTQEATMAQNPVRVAAPIIKAADMLQTNKLAVAMPPPITHNAPPPLAGPRQKLANTNEELQIAKPSPYAPNNKAIMPLPNAQRSRLLFDKAPARTLAPTLEPTPAIAPLAPTKPPAKPPAKPQAKPQAKPRVKPPAKPQAAKTTISPTKNWQDTSLVLKQMGVQDKFDATSPVFTFELSEDARMLGVVSTHALKTDQTLAQFIYQRVQKASAGCGKNNFSISQSPIETKIDGRMEVVVETTCRKGEATGSIALYEQLGAQVRHWQLSGPTTAQATMPPTMQEAKKNLQQYLLTIKPVGTLVPHVASLSAAN